LVVSRVCRSVLTTATTIVVIATITAALIAGDRTATPVNSLTPSQGNPNTAEEGRVDLYGDPLPRGQSRVWGQPGFARLTKRRAWHSLRTARRSQSTRAPGCT
jgi:hypothetical protein